MDAISVRIASIAGQELRNFGANTSKIVVGRDSTCDICLPDTSVSRQHTILRLSADAVLLEDTSANGTLVDGQVIRRQVVALAPDATISIGSYALRVERLGPALEERRSGKPAGG